MDRITKFMEKRLYVKTLDTYDQIETNEINGDQLKLKSFIDFTKRTSSVLLKVTWANTGLLNCLHVSEVYTASP